MVADNPADGLTHDSPAHGWECCTSARTLVHVFKPSIDNFSSFHDGDESVQGIANK